MQSTPNPVGEQLEIGAILFSGMDQADFTGPFEVLSRVPDSRFHILAKDLKLVRDAKGLVLTPETTFDQSPQLDVLLLPGGGGINALMEDEPTLGFVRKQAAGARIVLTVCTGALIAGAVGLLNGRRATTHWASHHFLEQFGATPVKARVVVDGNLVTTAGVTAGFDGALRVVAMLRGEKVAQGIQLYIQYAPEPPFNSGSPETATDEVLRTVEDQMKALIAERQKIIGRITRSPKS
jgi:cyclohexyl-isocyanide hydratase